MKFQSTLIVLLLIAVLLAGCTQPQPQACTLDAKLCPDGSYVGRNSQLNCEFDPCPNAPANNPDTLNPSAGDSMIAAQFTAAYPTLQATNNGAIQAVELPLALSEIENFESVRTQLNISQTDLLEQNGFFVNNALTSKSVSGFYATIRQNEIPVFVTSDSLLHLYHIQFDETLREIEETEFFPLLVGFTTALQNDSITRYNSYEGDLKEAARRNTAYFSVAARLLDETATVPAFVQEEVNAELEKIQAHAGFSKSPIFKYDEDYSQYVPRGHYTRSENLKKYFKTMMWYGRMGFLLKGQSYGGFISDDDAKIETVQASLVSIALASTEMSVENRASVYFTQDVWNRIYDVTAFYVGFADDLTPQEYNNALSDVFGDSFSATQLNQADKITQLQTTLALLRSPRIYGGTGACEAPPGNIQQILQECLDNSKGLRLMSQRFIPDSYWFSNLVGHLYTGESAQTPFTHVLSQGGPIRGFPRGLDALAVLGSQRALDILRAEGDLAYETGGENSKNIEDQLIELRDETAALPDSAWRQNLYWAWLDALRTLTDESDVSGTQSFMQTPAWKDKQLNTALASWAQLRHDTILYAKQSYTPVATSAPIVPAPVVGYVEPVPVFFEKLWALNEMTRIGLDKRGVLNEVSRARLQRLSEILRTVTDISQKELSNETLTEDEYEFIRTFGDQITNTFTDIEPEGLQTTIIADVHTDPNSSQVLEEGTGLLHTVVVAYRLPDGRILAGAGPVFSYYEFKHPLNDRLTDEKWNELLVGPNAPQVPAWTSSFVQS